MGTGAGRTLEWGTLVPVKATKSPWKDPQGQGGDPAPTPARDVGQGLCRGPPKIREQLFATSFGAAFPSPSSPGTSQSPGWGRAWRPSSPPSQGH